ncbi:MAG: DUF1203 domain-containing protein [Gammaproteobacteria bacterium]
MRLIARGIPTDQFEAYQAGGPDANGQPALVRMAEGLSNPCRHCLQIIREGDQKLVLSYRPFSTVQPYAETGPVFLHNRACPRYESEDLPAWFAQLQPAIVRGYDEDDWIRYDTGTVVAGRDLAAECLKILGNDGVAYAHIRSKFNCFQCRVDSG